MKIVWATALLACTLVTGAAEARPYQRHAHGAILGNGGSDYYRAASGHRVHRPVRASHAPAGASARCVDGAYSFSESRRGTCSHHGGVAHWL